MPDFEGLVDRIYQAATEPDQWSSVLDDLAKACGSAGAGLLTRRSDRWIGWRHSEAMVATGIDAYHRSDAATRSKTTARLLAFDRSGFVTNEELFTDEEYRADAFVTEWAAPSGMHHGAATAIHVPTGDLVVIQVQRRTGQPSFGDEDLERLDALRPHLARAGMLSARWRLERLRSAAEALALVGLPAVVLDFTGRVLAANHLVQSLAAEVVWRPADRIAFADRGATLLLQRAIAEMSVPTPLSVRSFPLRTEGTHDRLIAHLIPIVGPAQDVFGGGVRLLVLTPISASHLADVTLIRGLFDLTRAEALVARAIGEGLSADQIAGRQGLSRETVRTQIKAVLAKTGTHRQSEVAALIAGLPTLPRN
jgi:DNA-binding CsgD family transcriptional regulator